MAAVTAAKLAGAGVEGIARGVRSFPGVEHRIETYPARHGWVPSDTPAHDPAAAERHWKTLLELFGKKLRAA